MKIDTEAERQLAAEAGIRSIPTLVLFAGDVEIGRTSGVMTRAQIEQWTVRTLRAGTVRDLVTGQVTTGPDVPVRICVNAPVGDVAVDL